MKFFLTLSILLFSFSLEVQADRTKYIDLPGVKLEEHIVPDEVLSSSGGNSGERQIQNGVAKIVEQLIKGLGLFAFIWMVYAGLKMILSQGGEEEIEKGKRQIQWSIVALLLVFLVEPMVTTVFYGAGSDAGEQIFGPGTTIDENAVNQSAQAGLVEIMGFLKYIQMFVAIFALGMLIMSAIKTFFAQDQDDALDSQKKSITWIIVGILTITFSKIMIYFGIYNPETGDIGGDKAVIFSEISGLTAYLLGFVASIAVASIVYGGFLMVTSNGDSDQAGKGKNIIINIGIGSVIIFVSYTLVSLIVNSI